LIGLSSPKSSRARGRVQGGKATPNAHDKAVKGRQSGKKAFRQAVRQAIGHSGIQSIRQAFNQAVIQAIGQSGRQSGAIRVISIL